MKSSLLLFLMLVSYALCSQNLVITNATIVDVYTGALLGKQNLLVEEGLIVKISAKAIRNKKGYQVIDATGNYLMPGMIDTHIHFFQTGSLYTRPDAMNLTDVVPYEEELAFAEELAKDSFNRYLRLGITTVMDVGGPLSNFKVRDTIAKAQISPNVYVTGPLFSPYQPEALSKLDDVPIEKITSIEEATEFFNKMLLYKPDFIKIWYIASPSIPAEETYPIVKHIAKLTHDQNLKLAVHATQFKTAKLAVEAGADILVHSVDDQELTEEFAQLLKQNQVTYIPTLIVSKNYYTAFAGTPEDHLQDLKFANPRVYSTLKDVKQYTKTTMPAPLKRFQNNPAGFLGYYAKNSELMEKNLKFLQERGVNIATGTDAGNIGTMHASSYLQEVEAMKKGGLTNAQLLKAATVNAAKGFGLESQLGSITEGKIADMILLKKNPLEDIQHLTTITSVIKDGVFLKASEIIKETPEQLVQRQVNAYNARNIEAFLDTYAETIEIFNFPNESMLKGKEQLKDSFSKMFENTPNLYCEIKNRMILGNKVIDKEYVRFGNSYSNVIAIYEIKEGKIAKVTFVRE
ncbi:amidohydrolase family protein [uncultured Dokdonia sp.]|uniref:amidohydrolase family protein n=1 Tax=uncultured Dokdonia sp. TaxID=575653 RepID=UPI0026041E4C|nr:amidohydrolase family protein [uncultured Dokdonia sp.]